MQTGRLSFQSEYDFIEYDHWPEVRTRNGKLPVIRSVAKIRSSNSVLEASSKIRMGLKGPSTPLRQLVKDRKVVAGRSIHLAHVILLLE